MNGNDLYPNEKSGAREAKSKSENKGYRKNHW